MTVLLFCCQLVVLLPRSTTPLVFCDALNAQDEQDTYHKPLLLFQFVGKWWSEAELTAPWLTPWGQSPHSHHFVTSNTKVNPKPTDMVVPRGNDLAREYSMSKKRTKKKKKKTTHLELLERGVVIPRLGVHPSRVETPRNIYNRKRFKRSTRQTDWN